MLTFNDYNTVESFWKTDTWSVPIHNFRVTILPIDNTSNTYKDRTSCSYRIAGLPINTVADDLSNLIKSVKGKTCKIVQFDHRQLSEVAYVRVHPNHFDPNFIKRYDTLGTKIYVTNAASTVYCSICGSPSHKYKDCQSMIAKQRYPKKVFIQRNNQFNNITNQEPNNDRKRPTIYNNQNSTPIYFNTQHTYNRLNNGPANQINQNPNDNKYTTKGKQKENPYKQNENQYNNYHNANNSNTNIPSHNSFDRTNQLINDNRNLNQNINKLFEQMGYVQMELKAHRSIIETQQKIINNNSAGFEEASKRLDLIENTLKQIMTNHNYNPNPR